MAPMPVGPPLGTRPAASGGGFPWIWIAIGGGAFVVILILMVVVAARGAASVENPATTCESACAKLDACSVPRAGCTDACVQEPRLLECLQLEGCEAIAACVMRLQQP